MTQRDLWWDGPRDLTYGLRESRILAREDARKHKAARKARILHALAHPVLLVLYALALILLGLGGLQWLVGA